VAKTKLIVNLTRGNALCVGELADGPLKRMRGLIGRRGLPAGEGLLLRPAPAIHTAFMGFPIDAVFLDRELRVLEIVARLSPWRVASKSGARCVLELSAGECARRGVEVGDRLELRERRPVPPEEAAGFHSAQHRGGARYERNGSIIWPRQAEPGELVDVQPLRVLVVSHDRHFRSVATMLLGHRGCRVTTTSAADRIPALVARERIDVVVLDEGSSSQVHGAPDPVAAVDPRVGAVIVNDDGSQRAGGPLTLAKWGPFEDLLAAIERAGEARGANGAVR
jgi:uncharacterized protein